MEIELASNWHGLNRAVSPQNLPESESPDTTDARSIDKKVGVIGARLGRSHVASRNYEILGLGMLNAPIGRYRFTAETDGTWHAELIPWPAPSVPLAVERGWDKIQIRALSVAGVAGTTTYGPDSNGVTVGSFPLANYGTRLILPYPSEGEYTYTAAAVAAAVSTGEIAGNVAELVFAAPHGLTTGEVIEIDVDDNVFDGVFVITVINTTTITYALVAANQGPAAITGTVQNLGTPSDVDGVFTLQGYIAGAWVDLDTGFTTGTGTFTKVRMKAVLSAISANATIAFDWDLYLVYGIQQSVVTVP